MNETVRLDGVDISLSPENITNLFAEKQKQVQELAGRLDAMGLALEKERAAKAELEDPKVLEAKIQARLKLVEQCRSILGQDIRMDSKTNEELKLVLGRNLPYIMIFQSHTTLKITWAPFLFDQPSR
jgi:hypothetical protein